MNNVRVYTVNPAATKAALKADGRNVAAYARARGIVPTSLAQILRGEYPFQSNPESVYQHVLQTLKKDGYLVEADGQKAA